MASLIISEAMSKFPSTSSILSLYASFSTSAILLRNAYREIVPRCVADYVSHKLRTLFFNPPIQQDTDIIIIDNSWNNSCYDRNELVDAAGFYLSTKVGPENKQFRVAKFTKRKRFTSELAGAETVVDVFEGDEFNWYLPSEKKRRAGCRTLPGLIEQGRDIRGGDDSFSPEKCYRLSYNTRNRGKVFSRYLPHVLKVFGELSRELKLFIWSGSESYGRTGGGWRSMESRHPMTFDTIAMDGKLKQGIVDDLERFVARRELYKTVGKAWKRGYLLYGPPGTGKSSLVTAMSHHLKFNLYAMQLGDICSDHELRHALLSIENKSIVVFEDIDCCPELHARSDQSATTGLDHTNTPVHDGNQPKRKFPPKFTLATLLNCIDGFWSSHGEERIIVFTTNHKDVLDPALIRPGRMDMHIHLSYCTREAFRGLASIYLKVKGNHPLLEHVDELLQSVEVTPATLAEELMKGIDDVDGTLQQVVDFLNQAKKKKQLGKGQEESDVGKLLGKGKEK